MLTYFCTVPFLLNISRISTFWDLSQFSFYSDVPPLEDFSELIGQMKALGYTEPVKEDEKASTKSLNISDVPQPDKKEIKKEIKKEPFGNHAAVDVAKVCTKEKQTLEFLNLSMC